MRSSEEFPPGSDVGALTVPRGAQGDSEANRLCRDDRVSLVLVCVLFCQRRGRGHKADRG